MYDSLQTEFLFPTMYIPLLAKGSWAPILKPVPDPRWFYNGPLPYLLFMYTDAESKLVS
jgi:hypothetical protein